MKKLLVLALAIFAVVPAGARANGSPFSPGLQYGWPGVAERADGVHFVAFGMPKSTIVAAVRSRDGRVVRNRVLRGFWGVPLVTYSGVAGGLSGDRRSLVLGSYGPSPGASGTTRFVLLDTRTLAPRRTIVLGGSWSFDAISPNAATIYFTQHLRAGDAPLYRVRSYETRRGLLRGAIVDRLEGEEEMGGVPVARATSADGRWAYTLYARRTDEPFVHALDTVQAEAYCIDLPLRLGYEEQYGLGLALAASERSLVVRRGQRAVAKIDTRSWKVAAVRG